MPDSPAMVPPGPHAAVVCNPVKMDPARLEPLIADQEHALGWGETRWFTTSAEDAGRDAARAALRSRPSVVLAVGGDGTTRAVAQEAAGAGVPIAIVPVGSANVLARNLGLRISALQEAVRIAFTGRDRAVDIGMAELEASDGTRYRRSFLVMAGIGIDADTIAGTDPRVKRRLGWLAYAATSLPRVLCSVPFQTRIAVDGEDGARLAAHTVAICNCGTLPGGIRLLPGARIDDGRLDLLVLAPGGLLGWAQIARRFFIDHRLAALRGGRARDPLGSPGRMAPLRHLTCGAVDIGIGRPRACELDGEVFSRIVRLRARIAPRALLVRTPPTGPAGRRGAAR